MSSFTATFLRRPGVKNPVSYFGLTVKPSNKPPEKTVGRYPRSGEEDLYMKCGQLMSPFPHRNAQIVQTYLSVRNIIIQFCITAGHRRTYLIFLHVFIHLEQVRSQLLRSERFAESTGKFRTFKDKRGVVHSAVGVPACKQLNFWPLVKNVTQFNYCFIGNQLLITSVQKRCLHNSLNNQI